MKTAMIKRFTALLLSLAMVFALAACGPKDPQSDTPTIQPSAPAENAPVPPVDTPEPADTSITLVDQAGREIKLDAPAESIVSCYYITTYATMALGVVDRVIGLEKKADSRPIYHMAAPALLELPNVGSLKEFNVEAAAALDPDLVIMPMKLKDHAQTLSDLGINALVVNPESQAEMEEMLKLIAAACGVEEKAESILSYYASQLADVAKLTEGKEKPSVYLASNSSYLETAPAAMYQSDLITLAGGTNVAAQLEGNYWAEVSYETILTMNPEVIIIPCGASYTAEEVKADPQLADVSAVKDGKVFQMPQKIEEWDSPIPSGILGILWMTSVLHEDIYPFADMQADAAEYYTTFYGFDLDTALITK